jgi:sterol desaturase/sphingolipid hydroxylase (fatty acid hydroxylase superfamily)/uncharacterized membrane protein YdjX (TVP38/TMEM64 family)
MPLAGYESAVRLGCFGGVLLLMALWEALAPRRRLTVGWPMRWFSNLGLVALDTLAARFLAPLGVVGVAVAAEARGWGLFHNVALPAWLAVALAVVALDLAIYLQHVMFHAVPLLWRLHMVHHADLDFDTTTGVRFHTLEILLSLGIKAAVVLLLGAPALAVLVFEVLLNATSLFNHGNVCLPAWLDRALRLVVVTPEMHRVHHSVHPRETNSNFGFNLPWWDYLFGTYKSQPSDGHEGMTVGLEQFRDEWVDRLHWMLLLPFIGRIGEYPVNRRGSDPPRNAPSKESAARELSAEEHPAAKVPSPHSWARWGLVSVLALAVAGFYGLGLHDYVSWDYLRSHRDVLQGQVKEHLLLALVLFFLLYTAVAALSLPVATVLGLAAGAFFGRWLGTGVVSLAATMGGTLAFLCTRYLFRDWVWRRFGGRLAAVNWGVDRDGTYYLLALRLVPVVPFFLVNLGIGLTSVRVRTFLWVSLLGMLPGTFLYVNAGTELGRLDSPAGILSPGILLSLVLLGIVPLVLRRLVHSSRFHFPAPKGSAEEGAPGRDGRLVTPAGTHEASPASRVRRPA